MASLAAAVVPSLVASSSRPQICHALLATGRQFLRQRSSALQASPSLYSRSSVYGATISRAPSRSLATAAAVGTTTTKPSIAVGERIPDGELSYFDESGAIQSIKVSDLTSKKKVVIFACVSVNDAFVMKSWGEALGVNGKILMLSDGNGKFTRDLGVTVDLSDKVEGLGVRSRRYSLLAEDGIVKVLNLEEGGAYTVSSADEILKAL
ncbi:peroxiredoxin-2E-1, chloroplastic [Selaginella moellendorffii]|uniref:peroxiredoxin-2E-1, chloroplastic n=1 Tax=Selaginella moellendorffii TaxID=88036 RepID=UPI000D1CEA35|nr:peroxiredoxin-2E-1, chloroplastic [Selaginella moellendorffii]|eukprot:XP_002988789.2 peroxiredoxin-2E-1, chloroplastic [Selaginella moellendorffii]